MRMRFRGIILGRRSMLKNNPTASPIGRGSWRVSVGGKVIGVIIKSRGRYHEQGQPGEGRELLRDAVAEMVEKNK